MKFVFAIVFSLVAGMASAHSKLVRSTPANDAVLAVAPKVLALQFSTKIRLTKVTLNQDIDVGLGASTGFSKSATLPLAPMPGGMYEVEWRGLGLDGHALKGYFFFEVE